MRQIAILTSVAVLVLGIYVLPAATARFAGTHTWEVNQSSIGGQGLRCGKCHAYIKTELNATTLGDATFQKHRTAAANSVYINNTNSTLIQVATPGADIDDFCLMCHAVETGASGAGHTKVTIRVCTDGDCHGKHTENQSLKDVMYPNKLNITTQISASADAHANFFNPLNATDSDYVAEDTLDSVSVNTSSGNYKAGFYACMGCHTHVGVQLDSIARPNIYMFNMSYSAGTFTATGPVANETNLTNQEYQSFGSSGSKWR